MLEVSAPQVRTVHMCTGPAQPAPPCGSSTRAYVRAGSAKLYVRGGLALPQVTHHQYTITVSPCRLYFNSRRIRICTTHPVRGKYVERRLCHPTGSCIPSQGSVQLHSFSEILRDLFQVQTSLIRNFTLCVPKPVPPCFAKTPSKVHLPTWGVLSGTVMHTNLQASTQTSRLHMQR